MDAQGLGRYLRESREAKELLLEDAERALKIRRRILESFELGEFNQADFSSVQIRGFIRNYARFLGLDEDRVVGYYEAARREAETPARRSRRTTQTIPVITPVAPRKITDTNPSLPAVPVVVDARPRGGLLNTFVLLLVALASLAVIAFVVFQLIGRPSSDQSPDDTGLDILGQLPPTPTFTPVPTLTPPPTLTPVLGVQQNYAGQPVLVTIELAQRTWMRVASDGVQRYAGLARPGEVLEYPAQDNVTISAANAEALQIVYNGQQQPVFGGRGQQVDIVFRPGGAVQVSAGPGFEPTSEFTPTPFPTSAVDVGAAIAALTPSPTPGPSPTPTLTFTPSPTASLTPTATLTPSITPTPSDTPTATLTPTITLTPSPTAILPPRVTQEGLPPTKPPG
jgi:hypothetical protein